MSSEQGNFNALPYLLREYADKVSGDLSRSLSRGGPVHFSWKKLISFKLFPRISQSESILSNLDFPKKWQINLSQGKIGSALEGLFFDSINHYKWLVFFTKCLFEELFRFAYLDRSFIRTNHVIFFIFQWFLTMKIFFRLTPICLCCHDRKHATFNLASA